MLVEQTVPGAHLLFVKERQTLEITFLPDVVIDLDIAQNIFRHAKNIIGKEYHYNLVNATNIYKATAEARQLFAGIDSPLLLGCAVYYDDSIRKTISNFYSALNKPVKPTEIANSKQAAMEWIAERRKIDVAIFSV